jgi:prevent-host-death family protein
MQKIGAFEAKTRLAEILRQVEQGESVLITRRGKPVARLMPPEDADTEDFAALIERMNQRRKKLPDIPSEAVAAWAARGLRP